MAKVGAQRAAELTGRSKSTIQRAMKSGKISYELNEHNQRIIDVSELERAFGLVPQGNTASTATGGAVAGQVTAQTSSAEMEIQNAKHALEKERLNLQVQLLNEQLEAAREQIADLKAQRDQWQKQAQQVLLTSQVSQKQAEERITELREREEVRQRAAQQRRAAAMQQQQAQQGGQGNGTTSGKPQFRNVKAGNQNSEKQGSLLTSFFRGKKKKKRTA